MIDPIIAAIETCRREKAAYNAAHAKFYEANPHAIDPPDGMGDYFWDAFEEVLDMIPTSTAGVFALVTWADDMANELGARDLGDDERPYQIIENLAAAARALSARA